MTSTSEFPTPTVSSRAKESKTTVIDDPNTDRLIAIESARLEVEKELLSVQKQRLEIERQQLVISQQKHQLYLVQMNANFSQMGLQIIDPSQSTDDCNNV